MTVFDIKIVWDVVCPWCYIGSKRLERAINLYRRTYPGGRHDTFNITHIPYFINGPSFGPSVLIEDRMRSRMDAKSITRVLEHLYRLGQAEGLDLKFTGKVGQSRDAHRLVQLAIEKDQANALSGVESGGESFEEMTVEALYRAFFGEAKDVAEWDVLVDVGLGVRLGTEEELRNWLKTDGGGDVVDKAEQEGRAKGAKGVPRFEIQGTYTVEGAEDTGDLYEIFIKIKEEENSQP